MKSKTENIRDISEAWKILGDLKLIDTIFNHISSVMDDAPNSFQLAMNPNGFLPNEILENNVCVFPLKKYSIVDASQLGVNADGLQLHTELHLARMKQGVIIHTHSPNTIAVGNYEKGLLPLSQTAIEFVGDIEMVEYDGVFRSNVLTPQLISFAKKGGVALLRHHGVLIVADTIEEATYLTYYMEEACKIQVLTLSQGGIFSTPNQSAIDKAQEVLRNDRSQAAKELFAAFQRQLKSNYDAK